MITLIKDSTTRTVNFVFFLNLAFFGLFFLLMTHTLVCRRIKKKSKGRSLTFLARSEVLATLHFLGPTLRDSGAHLLSLSVLPFPPLSGVWYPIPTAGSTGGSLLVPLSQD